MDCQEAERTLNLVLDEKAGAEAAEAFRRHISACPACAGLWEDLKSQGNLIHEQIGRQPVPKLSAGFDQRFYALLKESEQASGTWEWADLWEIFRRRVLARPGLAFTAACATLVLAVLSSILHVGSSSRETQAQIWQQAALERAQDEALTSLAQDRAKNILNRVM